MAAVRSNKPHILAVPLPAQGHLTPLITLCRRIAEHGIRVTVVNPQCVHDRILYASKNSVECEDEQQHDIVLATVPDGLTAEDDRNDTFKLIATLRKTMPQDLTDLIETMNRSNPDDKVSCVIADFSFGWAFDVAEKVGAEPVGFSPPSLACLAVIHHSLKLLGEGGLHPNVSEISLSDDIPSWRREEFPWCFSTNPTMEKIGLDLLNIYKDAHKAKWSLCNSCHELEPAASHLLPNILPVGPLHLHHSDTTKSPLIPTSFYSQDSSCLSWLDTKPDRSVIYVSFGSLAAFSQKQLDELALALELSGRAFLWVIRPDLAKGSRFVYPDGLFERVGELGKIVEWAPQDEVLSHLSVGCFLSHCGWNSTLEGVSGGVPFLCWPHSADQLHNERYICDKWEIGLRIGFDEEGIRWRHEIREKMEMVFSEWKFKENALKLKDVCVRSVGEGGSSCKNLEKFINHLMY